MKTFPLIAAFLAGLTVAVAAPNCNVQDVDNCASVLFLSYWENSTIPNTVEAINVDCQKGRESAECVEQYINTCVNSRRQNLVKILYNAAKKVLDSHCTGKAEDSAEFISHVPCFEKTRASGAMCMRRYIADLEASVTVSTDKTVPVSCCFYQDFHNCYEKTLKENCQSSSVDFIMESLKGVASTLLDVVCSGDNDECKNLPPIDRTKPPSYKSVFPPIVALLERFGS